MTDLRVQKTQNVIQKTFIELVLEEGFKNVTVKEIAARALVNRKTFYQHYTDKYAVVDQLTSETLDWFKDLLSKRGALIDRGLGMAQAVTGLQPELKELLTQKRRPIQALMTIPEAQVALQTGILESLRATLRTVLQRPETDLEVAAIGGLMLGLVSYDLKYETVPTQAEFSQLATSISLILGGEHG